MGSLDSNRSKIFDKPNLELFAKNLKVVRKKYGFTQEELSYQSEITLSQIARIETAKINPSLSTIFKLAKTMNIHISELFDFDIK